MNRFTPRRGQPAQAPAESECLLLKPSPGFVRSAAVENLTRRAMSYLEVGLPLHLAGPAGTGKTTIAFHLAATIGRPSVLLQGCDDFGGSDLLGNEVGFRRRAVTDNFVRSVVRQEEEVKKMWADHRLVRACAEGWTVIYDEFNRSRAEANNVLLSILAENLVHLPRGGDGRGYLRVHPEFRVIFTSNPAEYAGTHRTQDALLDRVVTIRVDHPDQSTEVAIVAARTGVDGAQAARLVAVVREARGGENMGHLSVRAAIAIARIVIHRNARVDPDDEVFRWACIDVLGANATDPQEFLNPIFARVFPPVRDERTALPRRAANP